jgi:hypothetical protein
MIHPVVPESHIALDLLLRCYRTCGVPETRLTTLDLGFVPTEARHDPPVALRLIYMTEGSPPAATPAAPPRGLIRRRRHEHIPPLGVAGWRRQVAPVLGHLEVRTISNGAVVRAVHGWMTGNTQSANPRTSWTIRGRSPYNWATSSWLADALVTRFMNHYRGWAMSPSSPPARRPGSKRCPAAQFADINFGSWLWTVRRYTTMSPGGLVEIRGRVRRRVEDVGGHRISIVHSAAWRPNYNRRVARCYASYR